MDPINDPGYQRFLRQFGKWLEDCSAPIWFRNEQLNRLQGTMTFVDTGDRILGLTAGHVADRLFECWDKTPGKGCQVGHAELDPDRLIDRHPSLDLASFDLGRVFATTAQKNPVSVASWPPLPPAVGENVFLGGYPGKHRKERPEINEIQVDFVHFKVPVSDISETEFVMCLDIANSASLSRERIDAGEDLGGISGGGVFRVEESGLITRLELLGIVQRGLTELEVYFAHPLSSMKADGTFIR